MHIENFKCFKDFTIDLGPFNVLIGPNDSGKTTFLKAVWLAVLTGGGSALHESRSLLLETYYSLEAVWHGNPELEIVIDLQFGSPAFTGNRSMRITSREGAFNPCVPSLEEEHDALLRRSPGLRAMADETAADRFRAANVWGGAPPRVAFYRFDPEALRLPTGLATEMTERGEGLPSLLDNVNRRSPEVLREIGEHFTARFPHYRPPRVLVDRVDSENLLTLEFPTVGGQVLGVRSVSDGVLLSLAFIALAHEPDPPSILLVEEPENGVHHASLKDIIGTLRHLSQEKGVQVILTTHSPYLLDEVETNEVHVFEKDEEGAVHAKLLSEFDNVESMKKDFMTGEIWGILSKAHNI
jgi:predicted ATPase